VDIETIMRDKGVGITRGRMVRNGEGGEGVEVWEDDEEVANGKQNEEEEEKYTLDENWRR
jgi:hypothetical protein